MPKASRARGWKLGVGPFGSALALGGLALFSPDGASAMPVGPGSGGSGGGPRACTPTLTLDAQSMTVDLADNWPGTTYPITGGNPRIRAVEDDCSVTYLPVSRAFRLTQKPAGSTAALVVSGPTAKLTTDKLGAYSVAVDLCPDGCTSSGKTFSTRTVTYRMNAVSAKNLPPQTRPVVAKQTPTNPTDFCHKDVCGPSPFVGERNVEITCSGGSVSTAQWVTVEPFHGPQNYRLVEGWADTSGVAGNDLWLNHDSKDVNVDISPDPQNQFLAALQSNGGVMEIEWERDSIPERFRPYPGDRVSVWGYHIHDCGHAPYNTEIHPPVGMAVHRARPIRLPSNAQFDLPGGRSTVGTNVWVPGIVTDLWFTRDEGGILGDSFKALHQPASRITVAGNSLPVAKEGAAIHGPASLDSVFTFHVYLPPSPAKLYGDHAPVPIFTQVVPFGGTPANWPVPRIVESTDAEGTRFLTVTLDLRGFTGETYQSRLVAGWVYPSAKNWGLKAYSVKAKSFDVFDTGDFGSGDWRLWLNVPNASNVTDGVEWLKLFDCNGCVDEGTLSPSRWSRSLTDVDGRIREPVRLFPGDYFRVRTLGYDSDTIWDDDIGGLDEPYSYETLGDRTINASYQSSTGFYRFNYEISPAPAVGPAVLSPGATRLFDAYAMKGSLLNPAVLQGGNRLVLDGSSSPPPGSPPVKASTLGDLRFKGTKERNIFTITDAERAQALAPPAARQAFEKDLMRLRQRVCGRIGTPQMRKKTMDELSKIKGGIPADVWQRVFGDLEKGGSCAPPAPKTVRDHRILNAP